MSIFFAKIIQIIFTKMEYHIIIQTELKFMNKMLKIKNILDIAVMTLYNSKVMQAEQYQFSPSDLKCVRTVNILSLL